MYIETNTMRQKQTHKTAPIEKRPGTKNLFINFFDKRFSNRIPSDRSGIRWERVDRRSHSLRERQEGSEVC